jgi:hypothetical protein
MVRIRDKSSGRVCFWEDISGSVGVIDFCNIIVLEGIIDATGLKILIYK